MFEIYNKNENNIDQISIIYFLRRIRNLVFVLTQETTSLLEKDLTMKKIFAYLETNLLSFNEYHFVEILVLIRRFKVHDLKFEGKIEGLLQEIMKLFDNTPPTNVKIAAQVYYEYSLLHLPTNRIFTLLNGFLHNINQQVYFTGYTISLILKACAYNFGRLKHNYNADFCYQLLNLLEKHVKLFDLAYLCRLFKNICFLRLNLLTSHKRLHPCLLKIKTMIQEKKVHLQEKDFLCLFEGLIHAPVSFDNSLLLYLKSTVLYTIQKNPMNLTLKFLIKFVDLMGQQFREMKLRENSLEKVGDEILRRLQISVNVKFSLIYDCFKAFAERNMYCHKNLFEYLYGRLIKTNEDEINQNLVIFILKMLIPVKFECQEFALILKRKALKQNLNIPIDKLLDLLYIYSHPFFMKTPEFEGFCPDLMKAIQKGIDSEKIDITNSFLFFLAREYAHVKNPMFLKLQGEALKTLDKSWNNLRTERKFDLALTFINSRYNKQEWQQFLIGKTSNLIFEDIELLLKQYFMKETKEFNSFDLILKSLISTSQENRQKLLKKIFEIFTHTPPFKAINLKGNPNQNIFILIDLLNFDVDVQEFNITYTDVLKFARFFTILDMNTDFLLPIFFKAWKNNSLFKDFKGKDLLLGEIGAFIAESFSLSKNFYKFRKNMKIPIADDTLIVKKQSNKEDLESKSFEEKPNSNEKENELDLKFQDTLKISNEIFELLKAVFEESSNAQKKELTLSWLCRFSRICLFLFEYSPNFNKDFPQKIFVEMKAKIEDRVIDNRSNVVKALFCLIEMDLLGANFDLYQKEFIKTQLEVFIFVLLINRLFTILKEIFGFNINSDFNASYSTSSRENQKP